MTDTAPPIAFVWNAASKVMVPYGSHSSRAAEKYFADGQRYVMEEYKTRSTASHNHEFAWLADAWSNLPENLADEYPTPDSLRKRALIEAGYYTEQIIDCGTTPAALRVSQGIKSFPGEEFSLVIVRGGFVIVRRPKSQSRRAMNAQEFQDSKTKIMEIVSEMIGVSAQDLAKAGK